MNPIRIFLILSLLTITSSCITHQASSEASKTQSKSNSSEAVSGKGRGELLIVRGYNGNSPCDAAVIGAGNQPRVEPKELLTNLSVSCGDSKSVTYAQLREPLPNPHACVTWLRRLRDQNKNVLIVPDPTNGNRYHCILSEITPKQFVSGSQWVN